MLHNHCLLTFVTKQNVTQTQLLLTNLCNKAKCDTTKAKCYTITVTGGRDCLRREDQVPAHLHWLVTLPTACKQRVTNAY